MAGDRAKIAGLRLLTSWALQFAREKDAAELVIPTLNLLSGVMELDGMVNANTKEGLVWALDLARACH
jgi:hypothetical protein